MHILPYYDYISLYCILPACVGYCVTSCLPVYKRRPLPSHTIDCLAEEGLTLCPKRPFKGNTVNIIASLECCLFIFAQYSLL